MSSRRKDDPEAWKALRDTAELILVGLKDVQNTESRAGYLAQAIRREVEVAESKHKSLLIEIQVMLELVKVSHRPLPRVPPGFMDALRDAEAEAATILLEKVNRVLDGLQE